MSATGSVDSKIARVSGRAIVLRGNDIDTDRIIPARFLKTITFEGLDAHVFEDDRAQLRDAGRQHPFDDPASADASVLVVNKNFGCGSSREHAPQALYRRGIRAVVGESFAEIFASNSLMIGLVCVSLAEADMAALMSSLEADRSLPVDVDLIHQRVSAARNERPLLIPSPTRDALLTGQWDGAGLLLQRYDEVDAVDARLPYLRAQ